MRFFIKIFLVCFIAAFQAGFAADVELLTEKKDANFYDIQAAYNQFWEQTPQTKGSGWKQFKRWEYFWEQRVFPSGEFPSANSILHSLNNQNEKSGLQNSTLAFEWESLGPVQVPVAEGSTRKQGIGRLNIVRFDPTNDDILWVGAASGGVWKSTDGGQSWFTFPFTQFLSLGVSDIAVSPTNPNIVYAATGDANGSYSTSGTYFTIGLIKTTDGGDSWQQTNLSFELEDGVLLSRVLVHPENPDRLIVATSNSIQKSTDGGETWVTAEVGAYFKDLEFMPGNPQVVYASTYRRNGGAALYTSEDGGDSWSLIKTVSDACRIAIEVTPANPDVVYALVASRSLANFHSMQVSLDGGKSYEVFGDKNISPNILDRGDGTDWTNPLQGWYDLCLAVSPVDDETVFTGGINIWKTTDSGFDYQLVTHWYGGYSKPYIHADIHDIAFQGNYTIFAATDGGLYKSVNGGNSWVDLSDGLTITQFYRLGASQTDPELVIGGTQDNGTSKFNGTSWTHVYAGDGMECAIDPTNPQRMYASLYNGNLKRSTNGGRYFTRMIDENTTGGEGLWVTPFVIDPSNPQFIYAGYNDVWRSSNYGSDWRKISDINDYRKLTALAVAPSDPNTIYAASYSKLYKTKDMGVNWELLNNSSQAMTYIAVDHNNPDRIWVSYSGYNSDYKLYEFDGENWINLSGNLPNVPVNTVVIQKDSPDRLYIGTDIGVYFSDYGSGFWERFGSGLPNVIVSELEIQYSGKMLKAATYGRGMWQAPLMDCNLPEPTVTFEGSTTICQGDSIVLTAEAGYDKYEWSDGSTGRQITVKSAGTYSVKVYDGSDCFARSRAVIIEYVSVPDLDIKISGDYPVCVDQEIDISLSANFGFVEYLWSTGDTDKKIQITKVGTYIVTATTNDGCSVSDTVVIEYLPLPEKPDLWQYSNKIECSEAVAYQWYFNGEPIDGATEKVYILDQLGLYKVEITGENGCKIMSDEVNVVTAIEDAVPADNIFNIHPNPAENEIYLSAEINHPTLINISIVDVLGKTQIQRNIDHSGGTLTTSFNIQELPRGSYYLNIHYQDRLIVKKLIMK